MWLAHHEHRAAFSADLVTVDVDGPQARVALESADLVIASSHTEVEWDKPAGATYVQTWHGTPLKRVHYDVLWAPPGRLDYLDRDIKGGTTYYYRARAVNAAGPGDPSPVGSAAFIGPVTPLSDES